MYIYIYIYISISLSLYIYICVCMCIKKKPPESSRPKDRKLTGLDRGGCSRRVQFSSLGLSRDVGGPVHGVDDAHVLLLPRAVLKQDFPISQRVQGKVFPRPDARPGVELVS